LAGRVEERQAHEGNRGGWGASKGLNAAHRRRGHGEGEGEGVSGTPGNKAPGEGCRKKPDDKPNQHTGKRGERRRQKEGTVQRVG